MSVKNELSLIFPVFRDSARIASLLPDLNSFFQKWQFPFELIFVIDPSAEDEVQLIQGYAFQNQHISVQILKNPKRLGRGASVLRGLTHATGRVVFVGSVDLNIPLAEYLNVLQEFHTDPKLELLLGNRFDLKKPRHGQKNSWVLALESAQREKFQQKFTQIADPTCPFFAISQTGLEKIKPQLQLKRWFYAPQLIALALEYQLSISQKPVVSHDTPDSRFGFRETLQTLFM